MVKLRPAPILLAVLAFAQAAVAENWADDTSRLTQSMTRSKAICRAAKAIPLPKDDDGRDAPCNAEALYYGIGMKADPAAARVCAARHARTNPREDVDPFDGVGLLMTIYANGQGAPRNLDAAIAYACRLDGAPAEMDARILRLDRLRREGWAGNDFSVCDETTSGLLAGFCAGHAERFADADRRRRLDAVAEGLPAARKDAFAALRRAEAAYARALGENEVDLSGTMRGAMQTEAQGAQDAAFAQLVETLGAKPERPGGPSFQAADAKLNRVYKKLMATSDLSSWGTVEKDGIRRTQRAWLVYRDALRDFARGGSADPDAAAATLTEQRSAWLGSIGG